MCKHGTIGKFEIRKKIIGVDSCIASIIQALNKANIQTIASCCGHENRPGRIALADGRELFILPDYESARKLDKQYPDIWGKNLNAKT